MERTNQHISSMNRRDEQGLIPPRRQRVFMKGQKWYFLSRNDSQHGPYANLTLARSELALFLRRSGIVEFKL